jgi:O-antigen/teichoic acid export membrane protein
MEFVKLLKTTVSQNAIASGIRTFLQVIIGFGGSYMVIRMVDKQTFGAWALALTFASFLGLIDIGISSALIRFTASDGQNKHKYFWTVFAYFAGAGFLGSLFLLLFQSILKSFFFKGFDPSLSFLILTLLSVYVGFLSTVITNTLNGLQLMKRSSLVEVLKSFLFYLGTILLIPSLNLLAFPLAYLFSNTIGLFVALILTLKKTQLPFVKPDLDIFKKLMSFGLKSYGLTITAQIKNSFIKLLTSWLFNLEYVAFVELAQKITSYIRQFFTTIIMPVFPAASLYQAKNEMKKVKRLLSISQKAFSVIAASSIFVYIILAPFIVPIWLGPGFEWVVLISQIEAIGVFFIVLTAPGFAILQGLSKFKAILITSFLNLILFLGLTFVGGLALGFKGIYVGFSIGEIIIGLGFLYWLWKKSKLFK